MELFGFDLPFGVILTTVSVVQVICLIFKLPDNGKVSRFDVAVSLLLLAMVFGRTIYRIMEGTA